MTMTQQYAEMLRRYAGTLDGNEQPSKAEAIRQAARHMEELQARLNSTPEGCGSVLPVQHTYQGSCPDETTGWDSRDSECPACQAMDTRGTLSVDALAQEIRRVDGNHSLGAGALAEALMPLLAVRAATVPAGFALVPLEPTPEMVRAVFEEHGTSLVTDHYARAIYRTMVAATSRPTPKE